MHSFITLMIYTLVYIFTSPNFNCPVLRRAVNQIFATPANACNRLSVARQTSHTCIHYCVPNLDCCVFGRASYISAIFISKNK